MLPDGRVVPELDLWGPHLTCTIGDHLGVHLAAPHTVSSSTLWRYVVYLSPARVFNQLGQQEPIACLEVTGELRNTAHCALTVNGKAGWYVRSVESAFRSDKWAIPGELASESWSVRVDHSIASLWSASRDSCPSLTLLVLDSS